MNESNLSYLSPMFFYSTLYSFSLNSMLVVIKKFFICKFANNELANGMNKTNDTRICSANHSLTDTMRWSCIGADKTFSWTLFWLKFSLIEFFEQKLDYFFLNMQNKSFFKRLFYCCWTAMRFYISISAQKFVWISLSWLQQKICFSQHEIGSWKLHRNGKSSMH